MASFPKFYKHRRRKPVKKEILTIYCSCRLSVDGAEMVECHKCGEWFYFSCVCIKRDTMNNDEDWKCSSCFT